MTKKHCVPLPPAVLAEDLLDTPRPSERRELTWLRRPCTRSSEPSSESDDDEAG